MRPACCSLMLALVMVGCGVCVCVCVCVRVCVIIPVSSESNRQVMRYLSLEKAVQKANGRLS